jgi:hypothetical protein
MKMRFKKLILITAMLFLLIGIIPNIHASVWNPIWNPYLQAYYNMSGSGTSFVDLTGDATHNGTIYPGANFTPNGKNGGAINFNRSYANITGSKTLANFTNATRFTISFWINISNFSNDQYLFSKKGDGGLQGFDIIGAAIAGSNTSDMGMQILLSDVWAGSDINIRTTANVLHWNNYSNIIVSYDGTSKASGFHLYVNNVSAAYTTSDNTLTTWTQSGLRTLLLMGSEEGLTNFNNGSMDEVAIFTGYNFSQTDVSNMWNNGAGAFYYPNLQINLNSPLDNSILTTSNVNFNCSASAITTKIQNISLWINGVRNYTVNDGLDNFTELSISRNFGVGLGTYNWMCSAFDNVTAQINSSLRYFNISSLVENLQTFNSSSYETSLENFIINLSYHSSYSSITANLFYNGTSYTGTKTTIGENTIFTKAINIPIVSYVGNKSFYWEISLTNSSGTFKQNSTTYNQYINYTLFGVCNTTLTKMYMNISFRDEGNSSHLMTTIPISTFTYWLGDGSVNKTLTYINNTEWFEDTFCFVPLDKSVNVNVNVQYKSTNYPQRIYKNTLVLTNITTNRTLYLLEDGIYVTFQVLNLNTQQAISGVIVTGNRTIGSSDEQIAYYGVTGSDGTITFWLNPDFLHNFLFQASGYANYSTSIYPTQSSYTISLGGTTTEISNDYTKGISYLIKPTGDYLKNSTAYSFNFTLSSTYWTLDSFGFKLFYKNGTLAGETSSTSNGGVLNVNANTYNTSNMRMDFYYVINSSYYNGSRSWYVENGGTKFSILNFFNDLTLYMNAGFFGIDNFGRIILSIFIIVLVTGTVFYRYGLNSEAAILGVLFGLVYLLDIGIGLIPPLRAGSGNFSIPHFITIALGILLISFIIKEERR